MTDPHELFADRLIHAYRRARTTFTHGAIVATALAGFLLTEMPAVAVTGWLGFLLAAMGYHCHIGKRLVSGEKRGMSGINTRPLALLAASAGLGWGSAAAFLPFVSPPLQLLLILTLTAIAAASLPRMAALPLVHWSFMAGLFVPILIAMLASFGPQHWMIVVVLLLIWGGLADEARRAHDDLVEIYSAQQSLEAEAVRDTLTGIANRRSFDLNLEQEWRRAQRLRVPISLIMIDVDNFKKYNDRYGHPAGDRCLAQVAAALAGGARRAGDLVARYGGEEFVVLLFHTARDDALAIADGLRRSVQALGVAHEDAAAGVVTASLGGATVVPAQDDTASALVRAADAALYRAKAAGRNQVVWEFGQEAVRQDRSAL